MSIKLSEILPSGENYFLGLTIQRVNVDFGSFGEGSTFTLTLVKESGQNFTFQDTDFRDSIVPIVNFKFGELNVIAAVISWKETISDIGGKSIYTVTLAQYRRLFLNGFSIVEAFHMPSFFTSFGAFVNDEGVLEKPFLYRGTIYVSTVIVDGTIFGPPITEIFELFKNQNFNMGHSLVSFNFDGLDPDFNTEYLIKLRDDGKTSLFTIINDYSTTNNFDYSLSFELIDGIYRISFVKNTVVEQSDLFTENVPDNSTGGILEAIATAQSGEIINYERGFSIDKDFIQSTESSESVDFLHKQVINVVRGGAESDFLQFVKGDIHQFWGFTTSGTLAGPPDDLRIMEQILNNQNIIDTNTDLRRFMNLWGRQFVVNSTHLTQIKPLTPEQKEAVSKEKQAMVDLLEALLSHFNSLGGRRTGDHSRNAETIYRDFLIEYASNHPEIFNEHPMSVYGGLSDFLSASLDGPNDTVLLDPQSVVGIFHTELNSLWPLYPSVDTILGYLKRAEAYFDAEYVGLPLVSTQFSLEGVSENIQIPASVQATPFCFPSIDHPLINNATAIGNFRAADGRWPSYVELPKLPRDDSLTAYTWASKIESSINHIEAGSPKRHFVKVDVRQYNNYYIITLPGQLIRISTTKPLFGITTINPKIKLEIVDSLQNAFISSINSAKLYGPFVVSNGKSLDENSEDFITSLSGGSKFQVKNIINNKLVPEVFSQSGALSKADSINAMEDYIIKNILTLDRPVRSAYQFGSLTVAGLPIKEAFSGVVFPDGSFLNRISINFDIDGIKTSYYVQGSNTENLTIHEEDKKQIIPVAKIPEPKKEEVKIDEPKLESDPKQNTLSDEELKYIYKKPEGGQGIILGHAAGSNSGPFYDVRRMNYGDIDPNTFAGGTLITGLSFYTEWTHVRNLSEPESSPGYLLPGTRVNISIFSDSEHGPFLAYMEQSPQVFAPPLPE